MLATVAKTTERYIFVSQMQEAGRRLSRVLGTYFCGLHRMLPLGISPYIAREEERQRKGQLPSIYASLDSSALLTVTL